MLELKNIKKVYQTDKTQKVEVFNDLNITFDDCGFTAILGPSGCGKTTMLNIIGGLDRYTDGDLIVDGVSTKKFNQSDWDTYRNRRIGTVFQSYNLIPHLSLLSNVELAMTLSGSSQRYRKKKSIEALRLVGLEKLINKKPNQLSGGQMQRVAIARAIVNEPKIILADEPTGALDSKTSIQVMNILKDLSKDHLIVIVTHNEELANQYATRIIKMVDGEITSDKRVEKNEIVENKENVNINTTIDLNSADLTLVDTSFADKVNDNLMKTKEIKRKKKKSSMSFFTALNISLHNILTKKGRTALTSIASSFGIIGVAMVLSLSNGFGNYVERTERESLSQFPISIERTSITDTLTSQMNSGKDLEQYPDSSDIIVQKPTSSLVKLNDINQEYIEYINNVDKSLVSSIKYNYSISMNPLTQDSNGNIKMLSTGSSSLVNSLMGGSGYWSELVGDKDYMLSQYDIIGKYPENSNELLISVDKYNRVSYNTMKALGYDLDMGQNDTSKKFSFDEIINKEFKIYSNDDLFEEEVNGQDFEGRFLKPDADFFELSVIANKILTLSSKPEENAKENESLMLKFLAKFDLQSSTKTLNYYKLKSTEALNELYKTEAKKTLKIVGIIRPKSTTMVDLLGYGVYYTPELTQEILNLNNETKLTNEVRHHCFISKNESTGNQFELTCLSSLNSFKTLDITEYFNERLSTGTDKSVTSITIYPKSFKEKSKLIKYLDDYNKIHPENEVTYSDLSTMLISSIENMINIISIVLICFAAVALITSSVMMSIIMYTSVIERTKEIGILRAIGARKKDVSRLFQAETVIIGAISGLIGIIVTYILCIPINAILNSIYSEISLGSIAFLNPLHALLLIVISILLTLLAGLIPSRVAAKKDPVICLRCE